MLLTLNEGLLKRSIDRQVERQPLSPEVRRIVQECTAIIAKEVESVKTLVNEFAQFARFPTAQLTRENLNRVVTDALAVFNGRLDGIRVQERLAAGLPPVLIDAEQFQRTCEIIGLRGRVYLAANLIVL